MNKELKSKVQDLGDMLHLALPVSGVNQKLQPWREGLFIGETVVGHAVGYKGYNPARVIWTACDDCGKERWVQIRRVRLGHTFCHSCACRHKFKGSKYKNKEGYTIISIRKDDPYFAMAQKRKYGETGKVFEHRYVMAQSLGRCLEKGEVVHHRNGIRDDNRFENLQLTDNRNHKTDLSQMQLRIDQLEREKILFQWSKEQNAIPTQV